MTNHETQAINFLARATYAARFDPAAAMFDFPRAKIAKTAEFLGLEVTDVKQAAAGIEGVTDVYTWTDAFKAAVLPLCILF